MLSTSQFTQLKKLLEGKFRQVACPCGEVFYTCSGRAVYHSNACRQKYFRLGQESRHEDQALNELIREMEERIEPDPGEDPIERQLPPAQNRDVKILDALKEKEKLYSQKLKAI